MDARATELPAPNGELPSMEEIPAHPLLTASRVPDPVRAKWTRIFAKLCSDAVVHKDNPRHWTLWAILRLHGSLRGPSPHHSLCMQRLGRTRRSHTTTSAAL
jgi:hypothetical protein